MAFQGLQQSQKQTQSLVLAPQLRQSLKILQVPTLELRTVIQEELQTNPTLEELPMEGVSLEEEVGPDLPEDPSEDAAELRFAEDFSVLKKLEEDWRDYGSMESDHRQYTSEDAERRQHFFDSLTAETSLQEYLMRQAELSDVSAEVLQALEYVVGTLDDNGFLASPLGDIALMSGLPLRSVQRAVELLRTLDPPGIGAPDLRECLLQQLRQRGREGGAAALILGRHFDLLLRRRIPDLARKLGLGVEEVEDAIEEIAALDPAPGRRFRADTNQVVIPDVRVEKEDGEWKIHLNSDHIPRLRLSSTYKELLAKGSLSPQEREYLQGCFRSGRFLISSIEQRQQTIERITRELLHRQEGFFEEGVSKLRPLTMSQVAEAVGVHETTVSRAVANKYIETPHGVFELKYFFTPGYTAGDGQTISNTSIKEAIARLIEAENTAKPLSDQKIVKILSERQIQIARRTVAKYREELGIPPTNLRRQYS